MIRVLFMFPARAAGVAFPFFLKKRKQKKQPRAKILIMAYRCKPILLVAAIIKILRARGPHAQLTSNSMIVDGLMFLT